MGLLRFLLAIVVVLFHYGATAGFLMDSHTAVKAFFMISGFYMALILDQKYGRSPGGLRAFFINRLLRLYPLYAIVLVLTVTWYLLRLVMIGDRTPVPEIIAMREFLNAWQIAGIWASNLSLIGLDFICTWDWSAETGLTFLKSTDGVGEVKSVNLGATIWVIQAWSISMEMLFYLCAPFLARRSTVTLAFVILASLGIDLWISRGLGRTTYFFAPAQLYLFATGMMLHRFYVHFRIAERASANFRRAMAVAAALFATAWGLPFLWNEPPQLLLLSGFAALIPVLFAISRHSNWDRAIGNLSYPIYLSHLLVGGVLSVVFKRLGVTEALSIPLMVTSCILFAAVLHRLVETPIDRIRDSISDRLTSAR